MSVAQSVVPASQIPVDQVRFHHFSFVDPSGRLFWWNGGLYRGIAPARTAFYHRLFDEGIMSRLVASQLVVATERTELAMDGSGLILQHRTLPFVSYASEWCGEMLKDASLTILDLELELSGHGLGLQDAHPWNVMFDFSRPLFVDLGSIVSVDDRAPWRAFDEFRRFFLNPLRLMVQGHDRIARRLLQDHTYGVDDRDVAALAPTTLGDAVRRSAAAAVAALKRRTPAVLRPGLRRLAARTTLPANGHGSGLRATAVRQIRGQVEQIAMPVRETEWSDYYEKDHSFDQGVSPAGWMPKQTTVHRLLQELRPATVFDIGSNTGWFAELAARLGSRVVAVDTDEACVSRLYRRAKVTGLPILPLVMDIREPSPGCGIDDLLAAPAVERLKCDMVLALAVVHHLVFKQQLNFQQIVEGLSVFAGRWLLVEFIPKDDEYVRHWWTERHGWYDLDAFLDALKTRFARVTVHPSYPEPRVLVLCEK